LYVFALLGLIPAHCSSLSAQPRDAAQSEDTFPAPSGKRCIVVTGVSDAVDASTWFGQPIAQFLEVAGWCSQDVWDQSQVLTFCLRFSLLALLYLPNPRGLTTPTTLPLSCAILPPPPPRHVQEALQRLWECRLFPVYHEHNADAVRRAAVEAYSNPACATHRSSLATLRSLPRVSIAHLLATALPHPELLWRDTLGAPLALRSQRHRRRQLTRFPLSVAHDCHGSQASVWRKRRWHTYCWKGATSAYCRSLTPLCALSAHKCSSAPSTTWVSRRHEYCYALPSTPIAPQLSSPS
jgi:hypothetical protein